MIYRRTLKTIPEGERPRERLIQKGAESLTDAEVLAVIIGTGNDRETAVDLCRRLIAMGELDRAYGSGLRFLSEATVEELASIRGIGPAKAAQIKAAVELGRRIQSRTLKRTRIETAKDVKDLLMEKMRYLDKEHFNVILLDTKHQVIAVELAAIGSLNASIVHPREVFKSSIRKSAAAIILVHNHPSGDPTPSQEDVVVTKRLVQVGDLLGIKVLDHVIIGDDRYVSMKSLNVIQ